MTDVLIRNVDDGDLEQIRMAAAAQGVSMQQYLREAMRNQATYLRRRDALADIERRLVGRGSIAESDRLATIDAMHDTIEERSGDLGDSARR